MTRTPGGDRPHDPGPGRRPPFRPNPRQDQQNPQPADLKGL